MDLKIEDVHVGGGTPSLLEASAYMKIFGEIRQYFEVDEPCDFGIEANPEDLTEEKAFNLRETGINQLSIGVQSFFRRNLEVLGRRHSVEDSLEAIENAQNAGFDLVNIDMMYMLPEQTAHEWTQDLELAVEQGITQITLYPLLIVHYRPMHKRMKEGIIPEQPGKKEFEAMYYEAVNVLEEGGYKPIRHYSFTKRAKSTALLSVRWWDR